MHLYGKPDVIINPYRYAGGGGGGTTFGNASREFDGSSDIDLGSALDIGTGDASIACWIRWANKSTSQGGFDSGVFTAKVSIGISILSSSAVNGTFRYATGSQVITRFHFLPAVDVWHHYAATFDRDGNARVYLDGSYVTQNSITAGSATDFNTGGAHLGSSNGFFKMANGGRIADARVYNRVISDSEVADIAAGTHVDSGLVGWWLTDNDDVLDYAGSNDGTNDGSTYSTDGPFD